MNDTTNSVTDALQPVAWIRKNGIRFNAEAEPQDDSETALYSQTDIDTLRAENERLRTCFDRGADKWETFARAAGWVPPKRQDDAPLDFDGDFEEDLWDERDE